MKYNHVAVYVTDMEVALKLYRDFLGFIPMWDQVYPNENISQQLLDDSFRRKNSKIRDIFAISPEGQKIELVQPLEPQVSRTPRSSLGYPNSGIQEIAFDVTDIDTWFEKVKAAGYETQTDYIWEMGGILRAFLFYDTDGNAIQLVEETGAAQ